MTLTSSMYKEFTRPTVLFEITVEDSLGNLVPYSEVNGRPTTVQPFATGGVVWTGSTTATQATTDANADAVFVLLATQVEGEGQVRCNPRHCDSECTLAADEAMPDCASTYDTGLGMWDLTGAACDESLWQSTFDSCEQNCLATSVCTRHLFASTFWLWATPPTGSMLAEGSQAGFSAPADTSDTIVLQVSTTLSGVVSDRDDRPLANQNIRLVSADNSGTISTTTDSQGAYLAAIPEGDWRIRLGGSDSGRPSVSWFLDGGTLRVMGPRELDLVLPTVYLDVFVQDTQGNPVPDSTIQLDGYTIQPFTSNGVTWSGSVSGSSANVGSDGRARYTMLPSQIAGESVVQCPPWHCLSECTIAADAALPDCTGTYDTGMRDWSLTGVGCEESTWQATFDSCETTCLSDSVCTSYLSASTFRARVEPPPNTAYAPFVLTDQDMLADRALNIIL